MYYRKPYRTLNLKIGFFKFNVTAEMFLIILTGILFTMFALALQAGFFSVLAYLLWNYVIVPIFSIKTLTYMQAVIVGFVVFVIATLFAPKSN